MDFRKILSFFNKNLMFVCYKQGMTEEEKKWDDALLDLVNKGIIEVVETERGENGFRLKMGKEL
jgi:hypothetical protein